MRRYKLAVGAEHGVKPGQIVGAIANEGGIDGDQVGRIEIERTFSIVDLPDSLPAEVFSKLGRTKVCGRLIRLQPWVEGGPPHKAKRPPRE